jgi:hypothetical protein
MVFTIYFIFGLVQTTLIMLYTHFGVVEKIEIYKFSAFITQLSSSFYMFLFALIVYLRHGGFSFIDHSSKRKVLLFNNSNRIFFIALVAALLLFVFVNILYYNSSHPPYLLISIIFLLTLLTLLYLSLKRDDNHVG